eukprot:SAG31_NODE_1313_length_8853_cov_60.435458_7_plen_76_part_00
MQAIAALAVCCWLWAGGGGPGLLGKLLVHGAIEKASIISVQSSVAELMLVSIGTCFRIQRDRTAVITTFVGTPAA